MDERVSIGKVKRDLSELVNRVAFGGERIVLTSRGNPKAVLVSVGDYERLAGDEGDGGRRWAEWEARTRRNVETMRRRRGGRPLAVDGALAESRSDLEARDGRFGGD